MLFLSTCTGAMFFQEKLCLDYVNNTLFDNTAMCTSSQDNFYYFDLYHNIRRPDVFKKFINIMYHGYGWRVIISYFDINKPPFILHKCIN